MKNVLNPSRPSRRTAPNLCELMRDQGVSVAALAWILKCGRLRAFRLRHGAEIWTLDEVFMLIEACAPVSARVPVWGAAVTL